MENKVIIHQNRAIIEVRGLDRKKFLQGLITNDVEKASASNLIYAAMLSPQGRFLYDFFIFETLSLLFKIIGLDSLRSFCILIKILSSITIFIYIKYFLNKLSFF